MAHLWMRSNTDWILAPLAGKGAVLTGDSEQPIRARRSRGARTRDKAPRIVPDDGADAETWLLIADDRVGVNGTPLSLGIRALRDRDEIRVPGMPALFFSGECLAVVTAMPKTDPVANCPRCVQPIRADTPAVQCPQCRVWHHESEEYPCWTYGAKCAANCDQPTNLEAGYRWTPEEL